LFAKPEKWRLVHVDGNLVSQDLLKVPVWVQALKERSSDTLRPFIIRF
jgi:hypothetical protein